MSKPIYKEKLKIEPGTHSRVSQTTGKTSPGELPVIVKLSDPNTLSRITDKL